jgi:hypothetical protein
MANDKETIFLQGMIHSLYKNSSLIIQNNLFLTQNEAFLIVFIRVYSINFVRKGKIIIFTQ